MEQAIQNFIAKSRSLLRHEYLPKIERCLEKLSDEDIWWRANSSTNSIGNLVLHLEGNARQWILSGIGGVPDQRERDMEFEDRTDVSHRELLTHLATTVDEVDRMLARLPPSRILDLCHPQGREVTRLEAIYHVVEHFSMHTGQIILLTKMRLGLKVEFYEFVDGVPLERWHKSRNDESS